MEALTQPTLNSFVCFLAENNILSFIKEFASPVVAMAALGFTIYTYTQTQKALKNFARPIMSMYKTEAKVQKRSETDYLYDFTFGFKNIGNHPAEEVEIKIFYFFEGTHAGNVYSPANRIDPNVSYDSLYQLSLNKQSDETNTITFAIHLTHIDTITGQKYVEKFWHTYFGKSSLALATLSERETVEKSIK